MKRITQSGLRIFLALLVPWLTAWGFLALHLNRSTVTMALLLEVLAIAGVGDWLLALTACTAASLAFSWYYIDAIGSLTITTTQGAVTFTMMVFTAFTGSYLAIRAQRRASEAIRRREEMERLQQLSNVLLSAETVSEAAERAVQQVVQLFGVRGAVLHLESESRVFQAGTVSGASSRFEFLELYGSQPSAELSQALASLIKLVLDRARNAEERARIETAQRGEELRTTILNALAHNFKTPLTSIKAAASMLRGSTELPAESSRELIVVIDEEADRLDLLIRESLALARIEARQVNPRSEECSVAAIVGKVTSRVARYLEGRELRVEIPDDLPPVWGDAFLLEQMLSQVVDNAWKYSRPGARIRISAAVTERRIILTVRNEGSQIPFDERDRIFDRFYRGTVNRSRVEGTGLGLAIAKAIAQNHGGTIWLDCEPDGPAFRFSLPVEMGIAIDREPDYIADRR